MTFCVEDRREKTWGGRKLATPDMHKRTQELCHPSLNFHNLVTAYNADENQAQDEEREWGNATKSRISQEDREESRWKWRRDMGNTAGGVFFVPYCQESNGILALMLCIGHQARIDFNGNGNG